MRIIVSVLLQLKELKERQKQQLRHKALKRGLDPEYVNNRNIPCTIPTYSVI